jgi:hypothetical protein
VAGDPLTIEMEVEAARPVETPNFGIAVHTAEGAPVYATNTRMDSLAVDRIEGRATVSFAVASLPLHEGTFVVSLAVASQDESVVYHWLDRRLELSVFARGSGSGPVDLTGEWRIASGAEARPQVLGST